MYVLRKRTPLWLLRLVIGGMLCLNNDSARCLLNTREAGDNETFAGGSSQHFLKKAQEALNYPPPLKGDSSLPYSASLSESQATGRMSPLPSAPLLPEEQHVISTETSMIEERLPPAYSWLENYPAKPPPPSTYADIFPNFSQLTLKNGDPDSSPDYEAAVKRDATPPYSRLDPIHPVVSQTHVRRISPAALARWEKRKRHLLAIKHAGSGCGVRLHKKGLRKKYHGKTRASWNAIVSPQELATDIILIAHSLPAFKKKKFHHREARKFANQCLGLAQAGSAKYVNKYHREEGLEMLIQAEKAFTAQGKQAAARIIHRAILYILKTKP